jgi:phosphoserine aminotransferase
MRIINFNAGPAGLPLPALERARDEFIDFQGSGMSILEHSHRGKEYEGVHDEAIALLTEMLEVPPTHQILFLQGGASLQFAQVPMNFLQKDGSADYILTGTWSEKALDEAKLLGTPRVAATTLNQDKRYTRVPKQAELKLDAKASYVHLTSNNTIFGTQFHDFPDTGAVPLIADMSSDIAWKPIDVSKFGLIYAGAQKNLGPSGLVVVIIRKDLVEAGRKDIPVIFQYRTHVENNSLYNTPPTFSVYMLRNVLAEVKANGGLSAMEKLNREKAALLYSAIDARSDLFSCPVEKESRSTMNVVFTVKTPELETEFLAEAKKLKMEGLKGHRSVGGFRASIYNAVSRESVATLADFIKKFKA